MLAGWLSLLRRLVGEHDDLARGHRLALSVARHARVDIMTFASPMLIHEVSSDMEPRCVTMPFSGEPVERSAMRKPVSIASSATKTATTSPMPKMASSVTFQRWRRLRRL